MESGVAVQRQNELDDQLGRLIEGLIKEVEGQDDQSPLASRASGRVLKRLEQRLKVVDPVSREEAIKRRAAVLELGKTGDFRAIDLLKQAIYDSWEPVRQGVATAAGELGDPSALPLALTLLKDSDSEVVREAVSALKEIGDPRIVPVLLTFGQLAPALRLLAREAIVGVGEAVVPALIEAIQRPDNLAQDAIIALGRIGDDRAVAPLLNALDRMDGPLRPSIVEALGRIGDERATGPLVKLLDADDEKLQVSVASALARSPDARCVRPLMGILLRTQNVELQRHAIRALAATRDPRAVPPIARLLDSSDDTVREVAAEALGAIGDKSACDQLVKLLRSDNSTLLLKVISALRKVATDQAVPALIPLVQHANPSVRRQTVELLGDLRPEDAFDLFAELLSDDVSFEVRAAAAKGLGKLKDKHGIRLLEQALRDEPTVRCAAVMGLTSIGEKSVIPALLATLKDTTPVVRYHAVTGLGKLKAEQAIGAIQRLLEDKDSMVRTGAAKALKELGIERPVIPLSRRVALGFSRLIPNNVAALLPGGPLTLIAAPVLLATLAVIWFAVSSRTGPSGELETMVAISKVAEVAAVAWTEPENHAATVRKDGTIDIWDASDGSFLRRDDLGGRIQVAPCSGLNPEGLFLFKTSRESSEIAVFKGFGKKGSKPPGTWQTIDKRIASVSASSGGDVALLTFAKGSIELWRANSDEERIVFDFMDRPAPVLSGDGSRVVGQVWRPFDPQSPKFGEAFIVVYSTETGDIISETEIDLAEQSILQLILDGNGEVLTFVTSDGLASANVGEIASLASVNFKKTARVSGLRMLSATDYIGVQGSEVVVLHNAGDDAKSIKFHTSQDMRAVRAVDAVYCKQLDSILVSCSDHRSAWIVDIGSEKSQELHPLAIPEDVRNGK